MFGTQITSDNVSPKNLIYVRKVGFGVRSFETVDAVMFGRSELAGEPTVTVDQLQHADEVKTVQGVLRDIIQKIDGLND